ncbi:hypothetical protein EYF80_006768 [Liparis tanakae]|uniref:MADF domain-containing protein n=1 Tax=Liparis tanakae TaxID=230148 RepID=A0A4Z2IYF9_9TELE|nr:hypothetical protein EYF80_006768 [Liparis tanakae]
MNAIEELLSEEVRRYEHLYNPSMAGYKDAQMASNSWREISSNGVLAVDLCLKMWRRLRDKYVREKKAILLPFFIIAFLVGHAEGIVQGLSSVNQVQLCHWPWTLEMWAFGKAVVVGLEVVAVG